MKIEICVHFDTNVINFIVKLWDTNTFNYINKFLGGRKVKLKLLVVKHINIYIYFFLLNNSSAYNVCLYIQFMAWTLLSMVRGKV